MANVFAQFVDDAPQENVFAQFVDESKDTQPKEQDASQPAKGITSGLRAVHDTIDDYVTKPLLKGVADIASVEGYALEKEGAPSAGKFLQSASQLANAYLTSQQSQQAQEDAKKTIIDKDGNYGGYNLGTLAQDVSTSIPGMAAMGGLGAPLAKVSTMAASALGIGERLAKVASTGALGKGLAEGLAHAPALEKAAAGIDNFIGSGVGFGGAEGLYSGASNATQTQNEIRNTDINKLAQHPLFQETYNSETDPSLPTEQRLSQARDILATKAGDDVFAKTAIRTGLISGLTGGGMFGMLRGKVTGKALTGAEDGALKTAVKGFGIEGGQEAAQSAWEQRIQNEAKQNYADPNQDLNEGVLNAGLQGGVAGGVMGLAGGGGGGGAAVLAPTEVDKNPDTTSIDGSLIDSRSPEQLALPELVFTADGRSFSKKELIDGFKNNGADDQQALSYLSAITAIPVEHRTTENLLSTYTALQEKTKQDQAAAQEIAAHNQYMSNRANELDSQPALSNTVNDSAEIDANAQSDKALAFHEKEQADLAQKDAELKAMGLRTENTPEQTREYRKKRLELRAQSDQLNQDLAEALRTSSGEEAKNTQLSEQLQSALNVKPRSTITSPLPTTDHRSDAERAGTPTGASDSTPTEGLSNDQPTSTQPIPEQSQQASGPSDQSPDSQVSNEVSEIAPEESPYVKVTDNKGKAFHVLQADLDSDKETLPKHSIITGKRLPTPILRQDIASENTTGQVEVPKSGDVVNPSPSPAVDESNDQVTQAVSQPLSSEATAPHEIAAKNTQTQLPNKLFDNAIKSLGGLSVRGFVADKVNENTQFSEDGGKFYIGDTDGKQQVTKAVHTYGQAYQSHLTDAYNAQDNTQQNSPVPVDNATVTRGNEITPTVGETRSDVSAQEAIKQPSTTQATESVDKLPETGDISNNDQGNSVTSEDPQQWEMTHNEYAQHKDQEHEARRLENLAKVDADLATLRNKGDGYDALIAKEIAKVSHTITPEGKFSHNVRSGSRVYSSAHGFVINQLIKRKKNIESQTGKFRSSFVNDMTSRHATIQKAINDGKTIPQRVIDDLPTNFPELKYPAQQSPESIQANADVHSKLDNEIANLSSAELADVAKELGVKTSQFNNGESDVKQQHPDDIRAALDKVKSNSANVDADSGNFGPIHREFYHDVDGAIAKLTELQDGEAIAALHHPEVGNIDLVWGKEGTAKSDGYGLAKLIKYHPEVLGDLQGLLLTLTKNENRSTDRRIQLESKDHQAGIKLDWDGKQKTWLLTAFEKRTGNNTSTDTIDITGKDDTARLSSSLDKSITTSPENATGNEEKLTTKGSALADKATDNIQDFGEKLEGAKKHTYTFKEDLTTDIDVSATPLSKSFPQPDYDKLVAGGVEPQTAAIIAHLRAQIPTKPRKGHKLKSWSEKVEALRGFAKLLLDGDIPSQKVIDSITLIGSHGKHLAAMFEIADSILPSQIKALGDFGIEERHYHLYEGRSNVTKWAATSPKQRTALFNTKEDALAHIKEKVTDTTTTPKGEVLAKFDIWTERGKPGITFVGKKVAAGKFITLKEFTSTKEARDYVANNNAELVSLLKEKKITKDVRRSENNQRIGKDYRNGKNIDAEQFTKTFGFRGVQFGNWVNNDRRQQDLNNAYDGLMDLAEVLGIPPKALALNGELGLAFGARGTGGVDPAAAHYEPDQIVINLTKVSGAGSLAHEWWHAVDNYFGKQEKAGYLSESFAGRAPYQVRQEVYQAWTGITATIIKETKLAKRSAMMDKTRAKDYWSTIIEMTARSFERYIIGKLEDQGYSNDYLANIIPESTIDAQEKIEESDYPYPLQSEMEAVNKAYNKLFDTLETKETDKGTAIYEPKKDYGISETGADNTNDAGWRNNALQRPQVINAKTSTIKTGLTEVNSPQDALHVISSFSDYAQEQMVALVLGANNKVLQIIRHTAGLNDSSLVDPGVLAGSIHGIKGAKSVYFAHNHPSGKANQSKADRDITDKLTELLRETGISSKGMLVTVTGNEGTFYNSDEHVEDIDITETHAERTKNIPVTERHLISNTKIATESITGEDVAVRVANIIANGREGILLLDNQHTPVSFVEMSVDDMNRLRTNKTGTGASLLLKEIHETNARAMMMVIPKPTDGHMDYYSIVAKNLGAFAYNTGHTRMLDGIIGREGLANKGYDFNRQTPYFSKSQSQVTNPHTKSTLHAAITKALDKVFGEGWMQRLEATGKFKLISRDEAIQIAGQEAADAKGFYDANTDTSYFVHDNISKDASNKALLKLVLHEVGVHALQMGKTNEAFQALLKRFEAMKKTNPNVQAAFDSVPSDTKAEDKLEEALAYFIEHYADSTIAQRIVEAFRQLVRALGNTLIGKDKFIFSQWANKLTETELRNMAMSALKSAPSDLQFDNVGREAEGVKLSQSAMKSVVSNIKRGREAITQALLNKSTVHRAMFRQGMGWVDFEWGDEGGEITPKGKRPGAKGIAHIIEARQRKDGLSNQEARSLLFDLVDTIAKGEEVNRYESGLSISLKINYLNHQVLLARRNGANAWMVTGFKMDEPVDVGSGYDAPTSTQSVSTLTRNEVGAGSKTIPQQDDNSSNNIKFSRSAPTNTPAPKSMAGLADQARQFITNHTDSSKTFNWWHNTIGTQAHKATVDSHFKKVFEASMAMEESTAKFANAAADMAQSLLPKLEGLKSVSNEILKAQGWKRNKDAKAIGQAIFQTTLDDKPLTEAELVAQGYSPKQRTMYHEFFAAINKSMDDLAKSEMLREAKALSLVPANESLSLKDTASFYADQVDDANIIKSFFNKAEQIKKLQDQGYAPLMRFGQYTLDVNETLADGTEKRLFFGLFESQAEANEMAAAMQSEYPEATIAKGIMSQQDWQMFKGITPETMEVFAKLMNVDKDVAFQEYLKSAVNNRSALKRLIHRKKMPGFAADPQRVLASFITSNAKASAKNIHLGDMVKAITDIPKAKGDVLDEAVNLYNYVQNPSEKGAAIRGLLFTWYLGGSVASAIVNLTQTLTTTTPYLHQFGETQQVARIMAKAMKLAALKSGAIGGDLGKALKLAGEEGVTEPQELHMLYGESMRTGIIQSQLLRPLTKAWGSLFSLAESYNRRVAFIAAYTLAKETNKPDAFAFAAKAVNDTQFIYNKSARPNWARSTVGSMVFTFKTFSINYLEFLKQLPPKERLIALGILIVLSGLSGLPGDDDADDIIDSIGQGLGYNTNTKSWKQSALSDMVGKTAANYMLHGVSAGLPVDLSQRLGAGNLIPGSALFKRSETNKTRDIAEFVGPVGGLLTKGMDAFDAAQTRQGLGNKLSAIGKAIVPKAISDAWQGLDMLQSGQYKDVRGKKIVNTDATDALFKAIGLQPSSVAEQRRAERYLTQDVQLTKSVESDIAGLWAQGLNEKDQDKVKEAGALLKDWNDKNPDTPIRISHSQIVRRVKQMRLSSRDRLLKTAPKEMRRYANQLLANEE